MGGFIPGPSAGGGPVVAYAYVDNGGVLQPGSVGILSTLLAGVGDVDVNFIPGFFTSVIGALVNIQGSGIGFAFPGNLTINDCNVTTRNLAGANANLFFNIFIFGA